MTRLKVLEAAETIQYFIDAYSALGEAHMVDYFTKDHWNQLLDDNLRSDISSFSLHELRVLPAIPWTSNENKFLETHFITNPINDFTAISHYIEKAKNCCLFFSNVVTDISEVRKKLEFDSPCISTCSNAMNIESKEYMCAKKSHEVSLMAPLITCLCRTCETDSVLDIGSGKGYLSTFLTLRYNLFVTGIESSEDNSLNAAIRAKKYLSYWIKHSSNKDFRQNQSAQLEKANKFQSIVTHLAADTKLNVDESKSVVVGLHACGDLCCNIISLFVNHPNIVGLCAVGCCYHLNTEMTDGSQDSFLGFPMSSHFQKHNIKLGRTKRMLSLQAPERNANCEKSDTFTNSEKSLFYRALLSVIMKEELGVDVEKEEYKVGKVFSKSKNFLDYVRKSLKKLKINDHALSDTTIQNYLLKYSERQKEMVAFVALRHIYAPAVEMLILLDRYLYLLEQQSAAGVQECYLTELFDPVLSPRRFALVAFKNSESL